MKFFPVPADAKTFYEDIFKTYTVDNEEDIDMDDGWYSSIW